MLQWGRDQLIAEIGVSHGPRRCNPMVLQWGRDQLIAEILPGAAGIPIVLDLLQWGRDQLIAEISCGDCDAGVDAACFNGAAIS